MTLSEFHSKIPGIIIHPSHGELFLYIRYDKEGNDIVIGYTDKNNRNNSYGTFGKTYQEIYDSLYPFLIKQGHIK